MWNSSDGVVEFLQRRMAGARCEQTFLAFCQEEELKHLRVAELRRDACVCPPKADKLLLESLQMRAYPQVSSSFLLDWLRKVSVLKNLFADCVFNGRRREEAVYHTLVIAMQQPHVVYFSLLKMLLAQVDVTADGPAGWRHVRRRPHGMDCSR